MQRVVNRMGLPFVIVAALTLLAVAGASLFLAVGYRNQLGNLKTIIYTRCSQRHAYDVSNHEAVGGQLAYLDAQRRLAQANAPLTREFLATLPPDLQPKVAAVQARQQQALVTAIHRMSRAYHAGVIANCAVFK